MISMMITTPASPLRTQCRPGCENAWCMPNAQCRSSVLGVSDVASQAFRFFSSDECTPRASPSLVKNPKILFLFPPPTGPELSLCLGMVPQCAADPAGPLRLWSPGTLGAFVEIAADGGWSRGMGFCKERAFLEKLWSGTFCCRPVGGHGCGRG